MDRRHFLTGIAGIATPLTSFVPSLALGQTATALPASAAPPSANRVTVTGQTPIVTLQTWIDLYGRPTAQVKLDGLGPFKFVVDTGSNTSVISPRVASRLDLTEMPMRNVHGVTGVASSRFARIKRIETGRSVSTNLTVAIIDAPAMEQLDGILGMDMFADRRVRFSFSKKTVDIEPARQRAARRLPITASVRLRQGLLIEAPGKVGSVNARCVLDTGGDTTIVNQAMLAALQQRANRSRYNIEPPTILGVTSDQLKGVWATLPEINLIGLKIRRLTVVAADAPVFALWGLANVPAMLVGMDILSQVETLVVDYRRREVELQLLSSLVGGEIGMFRG